MNVIIEPHQLSGTIRAISSKSMAHRILILAALSDGIVDVDCTTTSQDIDTTVSCLEALGARITKTKRGWRIRGIRSHYSSAPKEVISADNTPARLEDMPILNCKESGSTFRFMVAVCAALGGSFCFVGAKRLAQRPLEPLYSLLSNAGITLSEQGEFPLTLTGALTATTFKLKGNVSSQYISGLLLAACAAQAAFTIVVEAPFESQDYVSMTIQALSYFGVQVEVTKPEDSSCPWVFAVDGTQMRCPLQPVVVEADWSNASFWLAAGAMGHSIRVEGLNLASLQGDRRILSCLMNFGAHVEQQEHAIEVNAKLMRGCTLELNDIIDLAPPLAATACFAWGNTTLTGAHRLQLKESNRIVAITRALSALGADITADDDAIYIHGRGRLNGAGTVSCANDHRIAMMAAICAAGSSRSCTLIGAECVAKSYPSFFEDFIELGGYIEIKED